MAVTELVVMERKAVVRRIYVVTMSLLGVLLLGAGILTLLVSEQRAIFFLLIALAILAQFVSTSAEITYEVGSAISLAATPLFGPVGAAVVAIFAHAGFWIINNYQNFLGWRKSLEQLGFNSGMHGISLFVAGSALVAVINALGDAGAWVLILPWLVAAIVADQVNLWLLSGIIYLQHHVRPFEVWWANRWAMPINVLVTAVGGGVLALAIQFFGLLGLGIFFLPIFLSAYAFRLYVKQTQEQMDRLEELVELRTSDLAEANKALAELHEQKDAFLAVLTHDMRSPLTNIHGYATLLRDHADFPDEQRRHMAEIILRNELALLDIVNNILDIEHLESGAPILLERQNFDLIFLIDELIESGQAPAQEKKIQIAHKSETRPVFIHADRQKVARILQNLLSNAVKYTPEEGQVTVAARMNGRHIYLEVADTGYGIPADELPHIFDRFSRVAKHKNKAVGTGLGLAIVKNLVEAHDGEINVTSEEGVGSLFQIKLPA